MFGVPGEPAHRVALAQEAFPALVIDVRRQHLDGDVSAQGGFVTAIETPAPPLATWRAFSNPADASSTASPPDRRRTLGPGLSRHLLGLNPSAKWIWRAQD